MKMHPLLDPEGGENEVCPLACAAEVDAREQHVGRRVEE